METQDVDPEIDAIEAAYKALRALDPEATPRVIHWLKSRLDDDYIKSKNQAESR